MKFLLNLLASAAVAYAQLPQEQTNGLSTWGTLQQKTYPPFLTKDSTPLPNGKPWGTRTVEGTNTYKDVPNTGMIRRYNFEIKRGYIAPDGVNKSVILINGQFPGPLIEANWGDTINVQVTNHIEGPEEGTALHWHGLTQKKTPWYDGVPSVGQCPIAPGKSFTYSFQASQYGSTWYHSHYSAQYSGGLLGPMMIYGPVQKSVSYDYDLGPIFVGDWYHMEYFDIIEKIVMSNTVERAAPASNNNLIQGKGVYPCNLPIPEGSNCIPNAGGYAKFQVKKGKKYRMRLINNSGEAVQYFRVDGHNLTIMANDLVPVKPYTTEVVTLGVGQRSDVILTANAPTGDSFWMRANISIPAGNAARLDQRLGLAALYYDTADTKKLPTTKEKPFTEKPGAPNDELTKTEPVYAIPAVTNPDYTVEILMDLRQNATNHTLFYMNNSSFRANYNQPILLLANQGNVSYPFSPQWNVYNTKTAKTVRIIMRSTLPISHPMHLHGHDFQVLGEGFGAYNGAIVRPSNPQRRDTQIFPIQDPSYYQVLQFEADNPGVWPFHCHIAWHVSQGMYINFIERPADITQKSIPGIVAQTCRDWAEYTKTEIVEQIDSGV